MEVLEYWTMRYHRMNGMTTSLSEGDGGGHSISLSVALRSFWSFLTASRLHSLLFSIFSTCRQEKHRWLLLKGETLSVGTSTLRSMRLACNWKFDGGIMSPPRALVSESRDGIRLFEVDKCRGSGIKIGSMGFFRRPLSGIFVTAQRI